VSGASSSANHNRALAAERGVPAEGQVVHVCGANEKLARCERAKLPADLQPRYHLHAYLHDDIALALAAADLAVMRSGASVLGELPATRLPAILVPGEYEGWDQSNNARYLEARARRSCCRSPPRIRAALDGNDAVPRPCLPRRHARGPGPPGSPDAALPRAAIVEIAGARQPAAAVPS
jgi:hypothetical protein